GHADGVAHLLRGALGTCPRRGVLPCGLAGGGGVRPLLGSWDGASARESVVRGPHRPGVAGDRHCRSRGPLGTAGPFRTHGRAVVSTRVRADSECRRGRGARVPTGRWGVVPRPGVACRVTHHEYCIMWYTDVAGVRTGGVRREHRCSHGCPVPGADHVPSGRTSPRTGRGRPVEILT